MFLVQEVALGARDEELAAVGVLARVGHGQEAGGVVPKLKVLVLEGASPAVDGEDARPVIVDKVAALDHEVLDDPMKGGSLESLGDAVLFELARAELAVVFRRLGAHVGEQLQKNPSDGRVAHRDIEEHHGVVRVTKGRRNLGPGRRPTATTTTNPTHCSLVCFSPKRFLQPKQTRLSGRT